MTDELFHTGPQDSAAQATKFTKYEEARGLLRDREGDIEKGVPVTKASTRLTFDDAVKDVEADDTVNGKKSTRNSSAGSSCTLRPCLAANG